AAIVGGIGTLYGPILGVIAVFAWPYLVPRANTIAVRSFTSGILLLVTLLFFPGGLAGLLQDLRRRLIDRLSAPDPAVLAPESGALGPDSGARTRVRAAPAPARSLEAAELSVKFGGVTALDDVSIHVE